MRAITGMLTAIIALSAPALVHAEPADAPAIRLNQHAVLAEPGQTAILIAPGQSPIGWQLIDATGKRVASGRTAAFGADRHSGQSVHRITFDAARLSGQGYRLTAGPATSRPFSVQPAPYGPLKRAAFNFFYQQRAGVPIQARFAGGERWARPAGHAGETASCVGGRDEFGNDWPRCTYSPDMSGGWYDAGDQGKYVVNGGISVWTLMNLYERATRRGEAQPFGDKGGLIPESGNGVDDLLDEARFELEWMMKMQVPAGTRLSVPVGQKQAQAGLSFTEIDAGGMAHHKMGDENWTPLPTPPHLDTAKRVLFPPSTAATLNLAAVTAQCARLWRGIDNRFADRCLASARAAWAAARRNPDVYAIAPFTGSGGYGDGTLSDEFFWAAAELFAATGDADARAVVEASPLLKGEPLSEPGWGSTATLGAITLMVSRPALGNEQRAALLRGLTAGADRFVSDRQSVGYAIPYGPENLPWGSNSNVLNRAILLGLAHDLTGRDAYRQGVVDAMDYLLGRNPLDQSYVSGFGARPIQHPHHRFWAPSADPALPPPPPGVLSGGPNSRLSSPAGRKLEGKCVHQTCWADDIGAYELNEVAVNWNAPLLWVAAWLDTPPG
ncbi:glycoside hydrolase family 9 protein [Sphingomonas sp. FW199]|uniref:glycoside hydrolase family 9 protein n=1 Tax=Sphingomonas sp. FW199 TaxID=3400217 RepID=UPI003CE7CCD1